MTLFGSKGQRQERLYAVEEQMCLDSTTIGQQENQTMPEVMRTISLPNTMAAHNGMILGKPPLMLGLFKAI